VKNYPGNLLPGYPSGTWVPAAALAAIAVCDMTNGPSWKLMTVISACAQHPASATRIGGRVYTSLCSRDRQITELQDATDTHSPLSYQHWHSVNDWQQTVVSVRDRDVTCKYHRSKTKVATPYLRLRLMART